MPIVVIALGSVAYLCLVLWIGRVCERMSLEYPETVPDEPDPANGGGAA